jgi:transcriptional regulator with XRE-family HTH domain
MRGNKLREFRANNGLTQEELAEMLGVSSAVVSHWETGKCKPRYVNEREIKSLMEEGVNGKGENQIAPLLDRSLEVLDVITSSGLSEGTEEIMFQIVRATIEEARKFAV